MITSDMPSNSTVISKIRLLVIFASFLPKTFKMWIKGVTKGNN